MNELTMGSLFDGIGGFPLAAVRNGITPVWASEIEAFPIAVTKQRFPDMLHVGDITKLDGATLPPVDIICGGSPCQDLSVAGARAGLAGERSGLFMEQIRITKEMRDEDIRRGRSALSVRPRYLCWENVPGAFSSGIEYGEDFRCVLEEIVRIKVPGISIPRPYSGRWESAGRILLGNDFSLWDMEHEYEVNPADFASMGKATPFEGMKLFGRCVLTVRDGKAVYNAEI